MSFLQDLAEATGLRFVALDPERGNLESVLVGKFNGYLTVVRLELDSERLPYYLILARYRPTSEMPALQKELSAALRHIPFLRNTGIRYAPHISAGLIIVTCSFGREQKYVDEMRGYLETITGILRKYSHPIPSDLCEGKACLTPSAGNARLVLVNKYPMYFCPDCIANHPAQIAQRAYAYQLAPSGLRQGIIAALLTSLVSSLIVAWMMNQGVGVGPFSIFVPLLAFIELDGFIERAKLKRATPLFWVVAASVALVSPLGNYLALAWRIWQSPELLQLKDILLYPAGQLGIEWNLMYFVPPWSLIIVLFLQQRIWSRYQEQLRILYNPQVWVVDDVR